MLKRSLLFALAALLAMPLLAHADTGLNLTLPSTDLSYKLIIQGLFGDIGGGSGGAGLSGAIGVFNQLCMFVVGILAAYTIVAGTMATAHDGEMLGQKWSSMWIPIRLAIGTAGMLPVLNGYSVIQAIIVWIAGQGMAAANAVWATYTASPVASATFIAPDTMMSARALAEKMLLANVCVQAHNVVHSGAQADAAADNAAGTPLTVEYTMDADAYAATPFTTAATAADPGAYGYAYGSDQDGADVCGTTTLQISPTGGPTLSTQSQTLNDLANMPAIHTAVDSAMKSGLDTLQAALVPMAQQIAAAASSSGGQKPPAPAAVNAALVAAAQAFSDNISTAAKNAPGALNQQVQANLQADGWLLAGAWYMKIANAGNQVSDALGNLPTVSGVDTNTRRNGKDTYDMNVNTSMAMARDLIAMGKPRGGVGSGAMTGLQAQSNADDNMSTKMLHWFIADRNLGFGSDANALLDQNPVIVATEMGHKLVRDSLGALFVGSAGSALAGVASGNFFTSKFGADTAMQLVFQLISPVFFLLFASMLTAGIGLALVLPMTPYIMWINGVVRYIVTIFQAVLGAQIWCVAHIHPDGDGVVGKGGQGYMLVLQLFMRPPLMVLGLLISIAAMTPIGYILNSTFAAATNESAFLNDGSGIVMAIAAMFLYSSVSVYLIKQVFSLIHVVPDEILHWIGGHAAPLLGDAMSGGTGAAEGTGKTVVGVVPNMTGNGAGALGKHLSDRLGKGKGKERGGNGSVAPSAPNDGGGKDPKGKPSGGGGAQTLSAARAAAQQAGQQGAQQGAGAQGQGSTGKASAEPGKAPETARRGEAGQQQGNATGERAAQPEKPEGQQAPRTLREDLDQFRERNKPNDPA